MNITYDVIKIEATKGAYAYAILKENEIILIDTSMPGRGKAMLSELGTYDVQPNMIKYILLTHHDIDHIGNAVYIAEKSDCKIYISREDMPYATGDKRREGIKSIFGSIMKAKIPADLVLEFDTDINEIEIIPTPGHTPGHTSFRFQNVLFTGDMLRTKNNKITPPSKLMTLDMKQNIASCKSLDIEGIEWICPAHGEPVRFYEDEWFEFVRMLG